jgi:branched-chain amino acid transport system ATP-binding protein
MTLLEAKNVTRHFGGLTAVNDVSFNVEGGEILGIIGPNGAGKTTMLNLLSGFLRPSSGEIIYQGKQINGLKPHEIAKVGVVRTFQQNNVYLGETVLANVMLGCKLRDKVGFWGTLFNTRYYTREETRKKEKAEEIIDVLGLKEDIYHLAGNLPHGQQRALGIAMALACDPKLLLLDEPVSGLSFKEMQIIMERIRAIRAGGIAVVLVEHEMRMVMNICERIIVLNFGKKIADGTPVQIKEKREVIEAYLGEDEERK